MTDSPIAIFSALDAEIEALVTDAGPVERLALEFGVTRRGVIGSTPVLLVKVGIGKVNAAAAAAVVIHQLKPRCVLFTGVAGAVDPSLRVGDVVVGELTLQHDAGVLNPEGLAHYQAGHVEFFNPTDELGYRPSGDLLEKARRASEAAVLNPIGGRVPAVSFGVIGTGDQFIADPTYGTILHRDLGVSAVEMEGAALAQVATTAGVDHLIVRAISDTADEESDFEFAQFVDTVAANSAAIVTELLPLI